NIRSGCCPQSARRTRRSQHWVGIAVTSELEIVFDTVKTTRKHPNLMARPQCSFVIGWTGEQTVQYEGEAQELHGSELKAVTTCTFALGLTVPLGLPGPESSTSLSNPNGSATAT